MPYTPGRWPGQYARHTSTGRTDRDFATLNCAFVCTTRNVHEQASSPRFRRRGPGCFSSPTTWTSQSGDDSVVVLEQRGNVEPVALVREARLDYLESRVRQIDGAPRRRPDTLRGSLTTGLGDAALDAASATSESAGRRSRPACRQPSRGDAASMMVAVTDARRADLVAIGPVANSGAGANLFSRAERHEATIYVPSLVLVEIAEAFHRRALRSDGGYSAWSRRLLNAGRFPVADLTGDIVLAAESL